MTPASAPLQRTVEESALLNPAFMATLLHRAVGGFERETTQGMPYPLAYLVAPVVLVKATRSLLPTRIDSSLAAWLQSHPHVRLQFAENARALVPAVREGLIFGMSKKVLSMEADRIRQTPLRYGAATAMSKNTADFQDVLNKANFVGRWYAHAGSLQTILTFWGVRL